MNDLVKTAVKLIEDEARGFIVEESLVGGPTGKVVFEVLKQLIWRQWDPAVNEVRLNLADAVDKHKANERAFREKVRRMLESGEGRALVTELVQSAARATTRERMEMLAAAAIGVLVPDFSSEMRSRVARIIEQLEPSDVVALRECVHVIDADLGLQQVPGIAENRVALLQTACLVPVQGAGFRNTYDATPVGRAVLQTLQSWPRTAQ
jgi:hypothetical protein